MARLRYNGLQAQLSSGLSSGDTSISFGSKLNHSGGVDVPTISAGDYIPLTILNPSGRLAEVVYLTEYVAGATTGTIQRGREGSSGVAHSSGAVVVNAFTAFDRTDVLYSARSVTPASFNPAPVSMTAVPGLGVATVEGGRTVYVSVGCYFNRANSLHFNLFVDGAKAWPASGDPIGQTDDGGNVWFEASNIPIVLSPGQHTIQLMYNAAFNTNGGEFRDSYIVVEDRASSSGGAIEPWREIGTSGQPAFQNSWVNHDTSWGSTNTEKAGFRKLPNGDVELRGTIKSGSMNQIAFQLPTGYRPAKTQLWSVASHSGGSYQLGVLMIDGTTGYVYPVAGSSALLSLNGVRFTPA